MRFSIILRYVGTVMLCVSAFMAVSAGISFWNNSDSGFYPLLLSSLLTLLLGAFPMLFVPKAESITNKEGFIIVVGSWVLACVVGMFPYLIWGGEFSLINAWFESVSGFTATGASILNDIEALPQGMLFWRSASAWIGGVGVVMFALVILPSLGTNKMALSNVELSSLAKDNYRYRTQIIVRILLVVYFGMTAATMLLLKAAGMRWFDAVCHAMSAVATCGFSPKNASVGFFDNVWIELILVVAMFLGSIHFGLIYATFTRKSNNIFRSEVVRVYVAIIAICSVCVAVSLRLSDIYPTIWSSLRKAGFQVVSLISTTGFATADTNIWPPFAIVMLIFVSIICACAGSTSGGLKVDRALLSGKLLVAKIRQQQHPNAVIRIRVDGVSQDDHQLHGAILFVVVYLALILFGTITGTAFGQDLMTAFSSAVSCVGNVGPGFGGVGSLSNFADVPTILKLQDTLLMLMGRLEIFGFIQLFFIKSWR
ncbi:MAG: TrkH family potassium uptake protein [Alistipes sp.]|jgi:trk system potassium uptake protein TrkH|nr:TrkH family potassium uptake protein [Alistipes sp.]